MCKLFIILNSLKQTAEGDLGLFFIYFIYFLIYIIYNYEQGRIMSKGKSNRAIKEKMIRKYGRKCFIEELGLRSPEEVEADLKKYKKNKRAELMSLTFHHIRERRLGGDASEENGAILRNINHIWFNSLSRAEQRRINNLFIKYKAQDKFIEFKDRIKVSENTYNYKREEKREEDRRRQEAYKWKEKYKWGIGEDEYSHEDEF